MKNIIILLISIIFLTNCSDSNSDESGSSENKTLKTTTTNQMTSVKLNGAENLALSPVTTGVNSINAGVQLVSASYTNMTKCNNMIDLVGIDIQIPGVSIRCILYAEKWDMSSDQLYVKYRTTTYSYYDDASSDPVEVLLYNYHDALVDNSGDVYHIDEPTKRASFTNDPVIYGYECKPYFILNGDIVRYDYVTQTTVMIKDDPLNIINFEIVPKNDGDFIFYTKSNGDIAIVHPDGSMDNDRNNYLSTNANSYFKVCSNLTCDIIYINSSRFKIFRILEDGTTNGTTHAMTVVPVEWAEFVANGAMGIVPYGPLVETWVGGCVRNYANEYYVVNCSNGKAFKIANDYLNVDTTGITYCDYGHCNYDDLTKIRVCSNNNSFYFYTTRTGSYKRLTSVDLSDDTWVDVTSEYDIDTLKCAGDGELYIYAKEETVAPSPSMINFSSLAGYGVLNIKNANTGNPIISSVPLDVSDIL